MEISRARISLVCAVGLLALALAPATRPSAASPLARAASSCHISASQGEALGPTYVTYIGVAGGASCSQAMRLVRSFYACRVKHGGVKGHCSGVEGFRCSERRYGVIRVQYDATVSCTRGRESIRHNYTQFT
jgi:hypothetical protein